jgi:ADP-ribose pyrophosphatase YjhB (NUDIX family)
MERKSPKLYIVAANVIEKNGKFLLVQEKIPECYGEWNLPAGRLKMNEDIIACAKREGEEETGLKLKPSYLLGIHQRIFGSKYNIILFVFKSEVVGGKLKISKEVLDAKWFSFEEIKEIGRKRKLLRVPYILKAIENYKAGKKIQLSAIVVRRSTNSPY